MFKKLAVSITGFLFFIIIQSLLGGFVSAANPVDRVPYLLDSSVKVTINASDSGAELESTATLNGIYDNNPEKIILDEYASDASQPSGLKTQCVSHVEVYGVGATIFGGWKISPENNTTTFKILTPLNINGVENNWPKLCNGHYEVVDAWVSGGPSWGIVFPTYSGGSRISFIPITPTSVAQQYSDEWVGNSHYAGWVPTSPPCPSSNTTNWYSTCNFNFAQLQQDKFLVDDNMRSAALRLKNISVGAPQVLSSTPLAVAPPRKTSIICNKGKITKKVTAVNPYCPTGYKKK